MDPNLIFCRPTADYKRDLNPVRSYVEDMSFYLKKMTGCSAQYAREFVVTHIKPTGRLPLHNPTVVYAERENYADRFEKTGTLMQYLGETIRDRNILAPTLTTYVHPSEREAIPSKSIRAGLQSRSKKKKAKFVHEQLRNQYLKANDAIEAQKENFLYLLNDALEKVEKIRNNSYSGAYISKSTPLTNKTSHAALTSTCRMTSGCANSNNEKFVAGNRHYFHPSLVLDNLITISRLTDLVKLEAVMEKYRLHYPTVEETLDVIKYSARLYWNPSQNTNWMQQIKDLIAKLLPIERAAFCYVSDMHHIRKFNDDFARKLLGRLSAHVEDPTMTEAEATEITNKVPESYLYLGMSICSSESVGAKNFKSLKGTPAYITIAATVRNIYQTLVDYSDFIAAMFVTDNMPLSVAHFPDSMRRIALVSDTDSTIFTVQEWVKWFTGSYDVTPVADAIESTLIFLTSETITHILATMSKNMGVDDAELKLIAMKNEFKFVTFTPTLLAKHYFANIIIQEGNVYEVTKTEIKGVNLKTLRIPAEVLNDATNLMNELMDALATNKQLYLRDILKRVANMERSVYQSLLKGDTRFFRASRVSDKSGYTKGPTESPYQHYLFWNEVFGPSYSICPPPPFMSINATLDLSSPGKIKAWTDTFEDRALAERLLNYMRKNGKKALGTFVIPRPMLDAHGLPKECIGQLQLRELVYRASSVYYYILDSLGVHLINNKLTRLAMDEF